MKKETGRKLDPNVVIKRFLNNESINKIKNDYCEDNYINLIRIRYDQIDNIEKLLFDNLKIYLKQKD